MNNEVKAKIFAAYLGSPYRVDYLSVTTKQPSFKVEKCLTPFDLYHYAPYHVTSVYTMTLLLKPLSAISDEDALKLGKMYGWEVEGNPFGGDITLPDEDVIKLIKYHAEDMQFSHKEIDTLRGWGYDCGYAEIPSLIEAGIAIKKETE